MPTLNAQAVQFNDGDQLRPDEQDEYYPGLERKSLVGAVDDVKPEGLVVARFSVFEIPDAPPWGTPDVVHKGFFAETLTERKGRIDLLHNHNWKALCGKNLDIWEGDTGAMAKSQYDLETFWGHETFTLIKNGDLNAYSFSFLPKRNRPGKKSWEKIDGVRHLYHGHLFELGPTPNAIAVHPQAGVIEAKSATPGVLTSMSFADMLLQAETVLEFLVREGEALAERRAERGPREGRKSLSTDVVEAIESSSERLTTQIERLAALTVQEGATPDREVESKSLKLRTDLARARLKQLGIITE
jgi:HK97 family phage prohead protease